MGALKNIYVQVAGLCMIAQRGRKLHVLMPSVNHDGHRHCPYLYVHPNMLVAIKGKAIDMSLWSTAGNHHDFKDRALEASMLTKKSSVRNRYLDDDPTGVLSARVTLPLSVDPLKRLGNDATLTVRFNDGSATEVKSYGRLGVLINVRQDVEVNALPIPELGITLTPDAQYGAIELVLLNVRPKDLGKKPETLKPNQHLFHLDSYFNLLDLNDVPPSIHSPNREIVGEPPRPGDDLCEGAALSAFPRWGPTFPDGERVPPRRDDRSIDPYSCTVGGGCPNGDC